MEGGGPAPGLGRRAFRWGLAREILSSVDSADLAYIVSIETNRVRQGGKSMEDVLVLRVTEIFRREEGAWRMMHRHADPQINKIPG
jgi:hypothetical protein